MASGFYGFYKMRSAASVRTFSSLLSLALAHTELAGNRSRTVERDGPERQRAEMAEAHNYPVPPVTALQTLAGLRIPPLSPQPSGGVEGKFWNRRELPSVSSNLTCCLESTFPTPLSLAPLSKEPPQHPGRSPVATLLNSMKPSVGLLGGKGSETPLNQRARCPGGGEGPRLREPPPDCPQDISTWLSQRQSEP